MFSIRDSTPDDRDEVLRVENEAFQREDILMLVRAMLDDDTAQPLLSYLACEDDEPVGHVFFSHATLAPRDSPSPSSLKVAILAPLAVVPKFQRQGIGGKLIAKGLKTLKESGYDLVFVLGHPSYYPRHGFEPALVHGLQAPYPVTGEDADAWMVQELRPELLGTVAGKVMCCKALDNPLHWTE